MTALCRRTNPARTALRAGHRTRFPHPRSFGQVLKKLIAREWTAAEPDIPVGDHEPLTALRR
ncbi:hypothetical protein OG747_36145 [Streptomyces sp. NBC_01384]|uniref:hypothetical protein n=1 Tax=Streptomyces sp. NBC_01384 TaxID=2903847 RepID=UPI00324A3555